MSDSRSTPVDHEDPIPKVESRDPKTPGQISISDIEKRSEVLIDRELNALEAARAATTGHSRDQLMGLALSGGGIRSATFSLGVMQALAREGVLAKMDYLSTVSGGGYIGSSLTWLLKEKPGAGVGPEDFPYGVEGSVPDTVSQDDSDQAKLLKFLRQHGKYLMPGNGITLLSGIAIVLRAILLNLLVWLPIIVLAMTGLLCLSKLLLSMGTLPWLDDLWASLPTKVLAEKKQDLVFFASLFVAAILVVSFVVACILYSIRTAAARGPSSYRRYFWRRSFEEWAGVVLSIIAALVVLGSVPIVVHFLEDQAQAAGPAAVAAGLASGIWTFFKAGQKYAGKVPLALVASVGAALLIYGLLVMSYSFADLILKASPHAGGYIWPLFGALLAVAVVTGWHVNLNYISIHRFYRDRLMETFMPNPDKAVKNETGAATQADPTLLSKVYDMKSPRGPYHIVNTNVVLVDSEVRRRRIRGGDNFILSPLYCGSNATGWHETGKFMNDGMTLATAMAISGAAANPNTGVGGAGLTRNPLVSILMALMNLRLGYWAPNPDGKRAKRSRPNHFHPGLYEIGGLIGIGGFREDRHFIQLSDGGHFENLAFYELIRRKLRLIIVCDGGADLNSKFGDLQVTLRRVEADFGALVAFDDQNSPGLLVPNEKAPYPKDTYEAVRGHIAGDILYADGSIGKLVFLKTTMVPGLPFAVKGYKGANPDFPDQTTADQFFDEEQFEAYRDLGRHIGGRMIEDKTLGLSNLISDIEKKPPGVEAS